MPEAPSEVSVPYKRKLSEKAANNGDPDVEQKQKRLEQLQKTGTSSAPAPTKKPIQASAKPMAPAKSIAPTKSMAPAKPMAPAKAMAPAKPMAPAKVATPAQAAKATAPAKAVEQINDDLEPEEAIDLPATHALEPIIVDDDDDDDDVIETPEEDDEAELSIYPYPVQKI
jgi:hypothetical protein